MGDMGVIVNTKLEWSDHISHARTKVEQCLWMIMHMVSFEALFTTKRIAYLSMVRSVIEYWGLPTGAWNVH